LFKCYILFIYICIYIYVKMYIYIYFIYHIRYTSVDVSYKSVSVQFFPLTKCQFITAICRSRCQYKRSCVWGSERRAAKNSFPHTWYLMTTVYSAVCSSSHGWRPFSSPNCTVPLHLSALVSTELCSAMCVLFQRFFFGGGGFF
jgi:hypothetical protein